MGKLELGNGHEFKHKSSWGHEHEHEHEWIEVP